MHKTKKKGGRDDGVQHACAYLSACEGAAVSEGVYAVDKGGEGFEHAFGGVLPCVVSADGGCDDCAVWSVLDACEFV